jgi:hypothetical protein
VVLERTMQTVARGREQLQAVVAPLPATEVEADDGLDALLEDGVFDQDDI